MSEKGDGTGEPTVVELLRGIGARLDRMDADAKELRAEVGARFDKVDVRFAGMDARFDKVDAEIEAARQESREHLVDLMGDTRQIREAIALRDAADTAAREVREAADASARDKIREIRERFVRPVDPTLETLARQGKTGT